MFSILRNAYLHRLRADRQHPCVSLDTAGEVAEPLGDPMPEIDPEQLQSALGELPEAFRTPIILFYFEDFSYRAIAEQMDALPFAPRRYTCGPAVALAAKLAEIAPGNLPKVLFTTGYARNAIVHQGRLDPGVELITKPFTYAGLAQKVRQVLES